MSKREEVSRIEEGKKSRQDEEMRKGENKEERGVRMGEEMRKGRERK